MPYYDYECLQCKEMFEISTKKMTSESERNPECPKCGNSDKKTLEFKFPGSPIKFIGNGWTNESLSSQIDFKQFGAKQKDRITPYDKVLYKNPK